MGSSACCYIYIWHIRVIISASLFYSAGIQPSYGNWSYPGDISTMGENNKCVHGECVHGYICYLCFWIVRVCVFAQSLSVCWYVRVFCFFFHGPQRSQGKQGLRESRSPAHRGKNSFLESYISTGICLMSARVERCIEHVRRPLAMRCG